MSGVEADRAERPGEVTLLLRPWTESDAAALREAIDEDVDHVRPWLSWTLEEPATLERTRVRLRGWVEDFRKGRAFRFAITAADRPSVILGGVSLAHRVGPRARDIGYWVRRSAAGKGIATAATCALANHAFAQGDVDRLVIQCDVTNTRSAAMARALGFEYLRKVTTTYPDGSPRPVLQFEMTRGAWERDNSAAFLARAQRVVVASPASPPASEP